MPINKFGGKKTKKQKNHSDVSYKTKETPIPSEESQNIAVVIKENGDCKFNCKIIDSNGLRNNVILVSLMRGRKSLGRVKMGSYILITMPDYETSKGYIEYLYNDNDISFLKNNEYISEIITDNDDSNIVFSNECINNNIKASNDEDFDISEI